MRRKRLVVLIAMILIFAALAPTVYAYMFHRSQTVQNVFVPAQVDCKVTETFDGSEKTEIKVTNTSNIDCCSSNFNIIYIFYSIINIFN